MLTFFLAFESFNKLCYVGKMTVELKCLSYFLWLFSKLLKFSKDLINPFIYFVALACH